MSERDELAAVLAEHRIGYEPRAYPAYVCYCGWDGAQGDDGSETDGQHDNDDAARAHQADALLASPQFARLIAAAKAEVLREAGQDFLAQHDGMGPQRLVRVRRWLFDRAATTEEPA